MISDFTAQYFGGNENCVNAKFELLLNHSNLITVVMGHQTLSMIVLASHRSQAPRFFYINPITAVLGHFEMHGMYSSSLENTDLPFSRGGLLYFGLFFAMAIGQG